MNNFKKEFLLFLTPSKAKSIVEKFVGIEPVFSLKGARKDQHVKYAYCFKYAGNLTRHISISSRSTEDGVTVYVNKRSSDNILYPQAELKQARVTKTYPMGLKGKTGDKGLSAAAARLPTLDPENNDVLKLSISSDDAFQRLLDWYFSKPREKPMDTRDPQESTGPSSFLNGEPTESHSPVSSKGLAAPVPGDELLDSPISTNEQEILERDTPFLKTAEREAVVKVRFGQGGFRELLLNYKTHGEKCWMSGIEGKRLLIASHIKPWSHCKEESDSRGNPDNGLLLSALWDTVFDAGLISFDADYKVVASSELSESARCALNLSEHTSLPEIFRTESRKAYLVYHRANVFEYWIKKDLL